MTATPGRLDLPARRRRHARLIAALTTLIGACAEAAGEVYRPIAAAPPDTAVTERSEEAATVLRELMVCGELAADDVLDEAVDSAVLTGLLALQEARTASDPSTAAELCLSAVPHIALAVTLASADLD
ncbi:hypothetical protein ACFXKS_34135 [Streptomyces scopuliridis]|uniref:hypothetical protein n=1 Tax=Streptomyces scopuliridis TaxID=452529 RepID=UPI00367E506A